MKAEIIRFTKEKDTKNTVRFNEVPASGKPPVIGTYLSLVVWGLPGHEVLLMDGACRHTEQYLLARRIFRSIRFAPHPGRP